MEVDEYINVDRILLDKKSYKSTLVYNILYKNFMNAKSFRIRFNKADGVIISEKSDIADDINYDFPRFRTDSNSLPIEKELTFDNVMILINSVVNGNKNRHCYNMLLKKGSYKEPNTQYV